MNSRVARPFPISEKGPGRVAHAAPTCTLVRVRRVLLLFFVAAFACGDEGDAHFTIKFASDFAPTRHGVSVLGVYQDGQMSPRGWEVLAPYVVPALGSANCDAGYDSLIPVGYASFLDGLKARIRAAQVKAALAVNAELVLLYWRIGRDILVRQEKEGWGARVIDRLSADLRVAFPEMQGFSPRNLKYMRAFAAAWPEPGRST